MRLRIVKISVAVVAFVLVFAALQRLLVPKYASFALEGGLIREYYSSSMDQDLILIGDCEVYANFSTIGFWENFGITSFIRGSPQQLVWHSYYLLEDTLLHARQKPKIVVFNIMAMQYGEPQFEPYNRLTLDGMRWSPTKFRAIAASRLDDESWLSYFFPIFRFKEHWRDLGSDDFRYFFRDPQASINGFMIRSDTMPVGFLPQPLPIANYRFSEKAYYYLNRMAELTREHDIELVLIKAPNLFPHWYNQWDEQIIEFAGEHDLLYINFLNYTEEIGLDWDIHSFNAGLHLNVFGAELMSMYFGEILQERFNLPDRRTESTVAEQWNSMAQQYHHMIALQLDEIERYGRINSFLIG
ncbi:MAG: SGNH/GDSL hydrolase family protein [Oscillospiraceae bacterium]|nr:SGNH/GDSL hydrolase family protein [Oscillospiraceae bacterium]